MNAPRERQTDQRKRAAAEAALALVEPLLGPKVVVGIGTGSTANCFIDALAPLRGRFASAVSSSDASTARLRAHGVAVTDLNDAELLTVYVDGADQVAPDRALTKGGGGALAREKIVAESARRFFCIVDDSKLAARLGTFPLPVEVIPMARRLVETRLSTLGGEPRLRADFVTDNGNLILDVHGLRIEEPAALEAEINAIPGVVENGIFARSTRPEVVLVATADGIRELR